MAEDEKDEKEFSHGMDWEVVSLTASIYDASPGPKGFDPHDESQIKEFNGNENPSSGEMFMSDHFVFPSGDRENIQMKSDFSEIYNEPGDQDVNLTKDEGDIPNKTHYGNCKTKSGDLLHGIQFSDNENSLSVHTMESLDGNTAQELTLEGENHGIYTDPEFGNFHAGTKIREPVLCDDCTDALPNDSHDESQFKDPNGKENASSGAMFMSDQFVFPSGDHENIQMKSDSNESYNEPGDQYVNLTNDESDIPNKTHDDNCKTKSGDLHGVQFSDNEKSLSAHNMESLEGKAMQELTLEGEEHGVDTDPEFGNFYAETTVDEPVLCDNSTDIFQPNDPSHKNHDLTDHMNASKSNEETKGDGPGFPCESWWKRQANSLYSHVKESSTFWTVFVAAAVMGLVVLGHRWQKEKSQLHQLKCQFSINSEMKNQRMVGPIVSQFKGILAGGHQHCLLSSGSATSSQFGI